jgi:predicted MPP superfamily phosphohydrolase
MQFSGHTHEGQLFPINLIVQNIYELSWGYQKIRNTHFFVTSGLRLWGPPVKTAGKSEIMLVEIHFE